MLQYFPQYSNIHLEEDSTLTSRAVSEHGAGFPSNHETKQHGMTRLPNCLESQVHVSLGFQHRYLVSLCSKKNPKNIGNFTRQQKMIPAAKKANPPKIAAFALQMVAGTH